jgi:hypothetical protein
MVNLFKYLDESGRSADRVLHFNDDAQDRFDTWLTQHENEARSGQYPTYWKSHLGKQAEGVAVLSIILHRLHEALEKTESNTVSLDTLKNALILQCYYEQHARRCYESIISTTVEDAQTILRLIQQKRLGWKEAQQYFPV